MTKYYLSLIACLCALFSTAQLQDVIVEEYTPTLETSTVPEGHTIYRVFARTQNPADRIIAVFAVECSPLDVSTTTSFYNDPLGGVNGAVVQPLLYQLFPSLEADSWVTIGADNSEGAGSADVNTVASLPLDPFTPSLQDPNGTNLEIEDGAWFANETSPATFPTGIDNRVLLGQFTTDGVLSFRINIQVNSGGLFNTSTLYLWNDDLTCTDGLMENIVAPEIGLVYEGAACGEEGACNYDPDAEVYDNAICNYDTCAGCTDPEACNYDEDATISDGSCADLCPGCMDEEAINYDEDATVDDESCQYAGCMDPFAGNYDPEVVEDDGSCEYFGCTDPEAWNYNPQSTDDDGSCQYDCDGQIIAVNMVDTFGDGWNGATYTIHDADDNLVAFGGLDNAQFGDGFSFGYNFHCLPNGTYIINTGGGMFDMENITSIECTGGEIVFIEGAGALDFEVSEGEDCIPGCDDPNADNYNPDATFTTDCIYSGCTDPEGDNYDPQANSDDGSCIYEMDGSVFYDANANGQFDSMFDYGIEGVLVTLEPGGLIAITDANGYYSFGEVESMTYTLTLEYLEAFPINTTANPVTTDLFDSNGSSNIDFGVSNDDAVTEIDVYMTSFGGVPCNGDEEFNWITIYNTGNQVLNGTVELEFDPLYQGFSPIGFDAEVTDNVVLINYTDLAAWQSMSFFFTLNGPAVEYIGEFVTNNVTALAVEGEEVVAFGTDSTTDEVTCAYDPNDKQAMPEGYTDQHFILNETPIDYTIRFQNTGNAPAGLVTLVDTLDIDFDLASFDVVAHSHDMMTVLDPVSRELTFTFENIQLPDSASDPVGSIGFVTYRIIPLPELAPNTTLENTAHIFFDSNPAIVTNTYVHTIYECGQEANFAANPSICLGDEFTAVADHPHVTYWSWNYDGEEIGTDGSVVYAPEFTGNFNLTLTAGNPLCETEQSLQIEVYELPEATFTSNGPELTASAGTAWQWYLNGAPIDGATDMTYMAVEDGNYSVEVTNDNGCMALSDEDWVQASNILGVDGLSANFYPNPVFASAELQLPDNGPWSITLFDGAGRQVINVDSYTDNQWTFNRGDLAAGGYVLKVKRMTTGEEATIELQLK